MGYGYLNFHIFSILKNLTYDQICHEHVTYYSLKVFKNLAEKIILKLLKLV